MSCCGNKRKEWMNEARYSGRQEENKIILNTKNVDKPDKLFEYIGDYSLAIKGMSSGKTYHFRHKGDKIKVDHNDSFALMAERDLRVIPSSVQEFENR